MNTVPLDGESPCRLNNTSPSECADYLNNHYYSYSWWHPNRSSVGVTIRGQPRFNRRGWFFCKGECFRGQPDCYVAASLFNHQVMYDPWTGYIAMPMDYPVGVIFQPKAIEERLVKCAWQYDGAAFQRLNGGCGCGSHGPARCDANAYTAFSNECPETGRDATGGCPSVDRCACTTEETKYPGTCYWRGPAFYSSAKPGAPPNMSAGGPNELRRMLQQRLSDDTGSTGDGIPLKKYWDELTIDGKVMLEMLKSDPSSAIAGFMYKRGDAVSHGWARKYNEQLKQQFGKGVPIIAMDLTHSMRSILSSWTFRPFHPEEAFEEDASLSLEEEKAVAV